MKKIVVPLVAIAAVSISAAATAQGYVSLDAGTGHVGIGCPEGLSCKTNPVAIKVIGGYELGHGLAAEVGYVDFGKAKVRGSGGELGFRGQAVTFGLAYQAKFNQDWALTMRLGLARVKGTASADMYGSSDSGGFYTGSDSSTQLYSGIGANYTLAQNVKLQLGVDFSRGKYSTESVAVHAITAGVRYSF
ncbi:MAG TPA: outer membrane beta-barrel protein [Burkholderiaceae bacterium]|jgi:hypothetical protein